MRLWVIFLCHVPVHYPHLASTAMSRLARLHSSSVLRRGYVRRAAVDLDPSRAWHNPATSWAGSGSGGGISPRALVTHLDSFVVGQERAKKVLAVA